MAKRKELEKEIIENISISSLDQVMCDDYSIYAKFVIKNRAIPDVRDGLKPVQRRIIFSMYENGNYFNKPTKKCARIVGDVMGKYHPHGDSSIYEALARMSQGWKINMNLIDFQGNNGSIDGDGPAAYRYTEARLTKLAEELIKDIDKDTVDMTLNFDDSELEPIVLPARFPNLLLNGTEGIAVAMATEIPPHNLKELIDATIFRINHPLCSVTDLLEFVKGPDFPTGANIIKSQGIIDIYTSGRGKIDIRSSYEIVSDGDKNQIIITEIPYKVIKKQIVFDIDKIRQSKEIDGIIDVIDATEMHKTKIVINIKKDCDPNIILNYLFQKTQLQTSYSANMVAIVDGRPQILSLTTYLDAYINHQREVITRRSNFDLNKSKRRLHIIDGLIKAISILDDVIKTIRLSANKSDAKNNLQTKYDFSEEQSEAIVNLQLYRLSNTDITKLNEEKNLLINEINQLEQILSDAKKLDKVIIADLKYISSIYSVERKTRIIETDSTISIDKRDLILKEDVMVSITRDGYIKRSSIKSYKSSNSMLPGLKSNDILVCADSANTVDFLLAFTNKGNYIFIPVHEILDAKWKDEGKHINYLSLLPFDEHIIKVIGVEEFIDGVYISTISKKGQIKKTSLKEFYAQRYSKPICTMKLLKNDELVDVAITTGNSDLLVINSNGAVSCFNENELAVVGNKTAGVKSINNLKDGQIVSLISIPPNQKSRLLLLTNKGCSRIADTSYVEKTNRLGKLTYLFKSFKSDPHELIAVKEFGKDVIQSEDGTIIYCMTNLNEIFELKITDYHLTPIDKYAKTNVEMPEKATLISGTYSFIIDYIKKDIKLYDSPKQVNTNSISDIENDEFIQISIFDEIGD